MYVFAQYRVYLYPNKKEIESNSLALTSKFLSDFKVIKEYHAIPFNMSVWEISLYNVCQCVEWLDYVVIYFDNRWNLWTLLKDS